MTEIFDDYIHKSVTKYRLNTKLSDWYLANKWPLIVFFIFPIILDLIFNTFAVFSIIKGIIILIIISVWVYLKYLFIKHVLVDRDKLIKPWKYNLYNALLWGLIIAILAIPSTLQDTFNGSFILNLVIVYIFGGLFSLIFTSLEIPRFRIYLNEE
ncbi:hypothetical protein [Companilactobacillus sp.]|uniref:hypothetical protein n=1 Tax=Companilactobacillus sp. TaxID=2767905 RepID=UPI0025C0AEDE|nr:hypothetical protein [Companilactobacillus sp.]MCH4008266.1 hypothetical protein [Companilactobacillus sp.]MCH4051555.1 hypothetical protein [Companilactobacillus sp.]MCH4076209.1 hypothetical protein [Companilactobacillus sp.]MCH4124784.1 hypothetical protein [Companilactobacillus sp.]MCH4131326.1 hypothetical protein [Companilactobacillus sp.]